MLNDFRGVNAGGSIERRERTNAAGTMTPRYSMTIQAEPLLHDFSDLALGKGVTDAIVAVLREAMRTRGGKATEATQHKRVTAITALAIGHPSTVRRYTGGRTGATPPNIDGGGRLYYDSGRFANGIVAMQNPKEGNGWTINVPANRLDPTTFGGGEPAIIAFWRRLTTDIPEFLGGAALAAHKEIRAAIEQAIPAAIYVVKRDATAKLAQGRWQLAARVARDAMKLITMG